MLWVTFFFTTADYCISFYRPWKSLFCNVGVAESLRTVDTPPNFFFAFLSPMSLRRTSKDLNSCPPPPPSSFRQNLDKSSSSFSDSNKLADFNNINKEILPIKNPPKNSSKKKILPKKSSQKISPQIPNKSKNFAKVPNFKDI